MIIFLFSWQLLTPALHKVPTRDANSVILEPTLHDQIDTSLNLKHVPPYDDKWKTDPQCLAFLKQCVTFKPNPRSQSSLECWSDWKDGNVTSNIISIITLLIFVAGLFEEAPLPRPLSPILTASSRKQTPRLGSTSTAKAYSLETLVSSYDIKAIEGRDDNEGTSPNLNDALYVCAYCGFVKHETHFSRDEGDTVSQSTLPPVRKCLISSTSP